MKTENTYIVRDLDDFKKRGLSAWYAIITKGGKDIFTGKTAEDYRVEGCTILSEEEFRAIYTAADDALCGDWAEETEQQYDDALNILPPAKWYSGGFYVPEAYTANIYSFHQRMNGRYYTSLQRSSTPRAAILESLSAWIKSNETKGAEK